MLHWIGLVSCVAAGVVAARWVLARTDSLGRARPFPWLSTAVLVVVGCAALTPWFLRVRLENRLSAAASSVAGTPVDVRCQSVGGTFLDAGADLGNVAIGPDGIPETSALIKWSQCRDLSAYLGSDKQAPSREQIVAVHVLTHESIHMSGIADEAQTECLAVQRDAAMAQLLGASPDAARALAAHYWQAVYPRLPADYQSAECGPGGDLDAGLADAPWALVR